MADETAISVPMKAPDDVTELLVALRNDGIGLSEISVQKPTLDEVFLVLTGKKNEEKGLEESHEHLN
jgi:ABC-2 type transport system ATP-binding protein